MEDTLINDYVKTTHSPREWQALFESESFDMTYCYYGNDLGVTYTPEMTTIKVWAPTAISIVLSLYLDGNKSKAERQLSLCQSKQYKGIWEIELKGDYKGYYYIFTTTANGKAIMSGDPYAKACGINGLRSMIVDLRETHPDKWEEDKHVLPPISDIIIYEVHIGDFSNDPNSGIMKKHQGKYLAFTDQDSVYNNDKSKPTCLNYLKHLGITSIHLNPCYDFGSIDESIENNDQFNWGYDPVNYNVPEGSYATNAFKGEVRIKEFKQMIQSIHNAGLSVIMDVVYNHTYSNVSHFNAVVPFYYYRLEEDGKYCNGSGCGNDTASERHMVHKYIVDSVLYWFNEYHIDGFRFDLMGLHDTRLMNAIRTHLDKEENGSQAIIYGEPWSCGRTNMRKGFIPANKNNINELHKHISIFNDDLRDAIKGKYCNTEKGFINGGIDFERQVERYFSGKISLDYPQPKTPSRLISYLSCHDNNTLWDKLVDSVIGDKEYTKPNHELILMNKLGASLMMLSFGVPFFLAGEEGARTKLGEENSFNLSKELNQLDWKRIYNNEELITYYRELIKLRKNLHSFYKLKTVKIQWLTNLPSGVIACHLKKTKSDDMNELLMIFNSTKAQTKVACIKGIWKRLLCSSLVIDKDNEFVQNEIVSEGLSTIVLAK